MKLVNYNLENAIDFELDCVWTLVCENQMRFVDFTKDFYCQTRGQQGGWKIYDADKEVDMAKYVTYVADYHDLDLNSKKATAVLQDNVKKLAFNEKHVVETNELLTDIAKYFVSLTQDIDYPTSVKDVDVAQLLKAVSVAFLEEYDSLFEKLIDYVTLLSRLTCVKIVIFVNLRSYLIDEQLDALFNHCRAQDVSVLCVESHYKTKLPSETILCCDEDLCEFFPKT